MILPSGYAKISRVHTLGTAHRTATTDTTAKPTRFSRLIGYRGAQKATGQIPALKHSRVDQHKGQERQVLGRISLVETVQRIPQHAVLLLAAVLPSQ